MRWFIKPLLPITTAAVVTTTVILLTTIQNYIGLRNKSREKMYLAVIHSDPNRPVCYAKTLEITAHPRLELAVNVYCM
ncbi:hypothetical protein QVD17_16454 [Tagetes erecta]|uniref:Uncharacterized protein n=1 Tax=Tagetes erecta TaxID=13708 RepID=A0AAD8KQX8_TARER|nr:hypothetical protein QVD17_16454 [Tagetes erecta]